VPTAVAADGALGLRLDASEIAAIDEAFVRGGQRRADALTTRDFVAMASAARATELTPDRSFTAF
jgi:hypothetical protein